MTGGVAAALLLAVWLPAPVASAKYAVVSEAQFRLEVPDTWEVSRKELADDQKTWLVHLGSPDRALRVRVRATPIGGEAVDLKQRLAAYEQDHLTQETEELAQQHVGEVEEAEGRKTLTAAYSALMRRKSSVQKYVVMTTLIAAKRGWLYSLTSFVQDDRFKAHEAELGAIVSSFTLIGAGRVPDEGEHQVAKAAFRGATRPIEDTAAGWRLTVPEHYTLAKPTTGGEPARIRSPKRNVRIFVSASAHEGEAFDAAAYWKDFAKHGARFALEGLEPIVGAESEEEHAGLKVSFRGFAAFARRTQHTRPYRVFAATAFDPKGRRVFFVTVALARDEYLRNEGLGQAILASFEALPKP